MTAGDCCCVDDEDVNADRRDLRGGVESLVLLHCVCVADSISTPSSELELLASLDRLQQEPYRYGQ